MALWYAVAHLWHMPTTTQLIWLMGQSSKTRVSSPSLLTPTDVEKGEGLNERGDNLTNLVINGASLLTQKQSRGRVERHARERCTTQELDDTEYKENHRKRCLAMLAPGRVVLACEETAVPQTAIWKCTTSKPTYLPNAAVPGESHARHYNNNPEDSRLNALEVPD